MCEHVRGNVLCKVLENIKIHIKHMLTAWAHVWEELGMVKGVAGCYRKVKSFVCAEHWLFYIKVCCMDVWCWLLGNP